MGGQMWEDVACNGSEIVSIAEAGRKGGEARYHLDVRVRPRVTPEVGVVVARRHGAQVADAGGAAAGDVKPSG